jgi:GT2 family glycosyltransferase
LGGWSFGDQGQFFHRAALGSVGGVPDIPLMEDVELSLRLGEAGGSVYLGGGLQVLARSWKTAFFRRVWLVIRLVLRYRWRRLRGEIRSDDLYAAYYPGKGRVHEPGCTGKGKCARE